MGDLSEEVVGLVKGLFLGAGGSEGEGGEGREGLRGGEVWEGHFGSGLLLPKKWDGFEI